MTGTALVSRLPYTDVHGRTIDIHNGQVVIAGRPYSPVDALNLAAHLGHAVALIGAQRAATVRPHTNPNHTEPKEAAHG